MQNDKDTKAQIRITLKDYLSRKTAPNRIFSVKKEPTPQEIAAIEVKIEREEKENAEIEKKEKEENIKIQAANEKAF